MCLISSGIVRILLSYELAWLKLALLVIFDFGLGSKLTCLFPFLFYFLVRFRFLRMPCRFFSSFLSIGRPSVSFIVMYCLFRFLRTAFRLFSSSVPSNTIRWHLMSDVCLFLIKLMYNDVVPEEVIWTVNWLHYLNYEPISRTSITCYLVRTRNNLGQTVTSYGWCDRIPRVVPFFRFFLEQFVSDLIYYRR